MARSCSVASWLRYGAWGLGTGDQELLSQSPPPNPQSAIQRRRSMDTVGIGMIGSGYMALTYAEALARHTTGARLVAIAGGRRAPSLAAEYEVDVEDSVDNLFTRADIDAVILTTPDQVHCAQTLQAA